MRRIAYVFALIMGLWSSCAQAFPQILLYNYTPPIPSFELASITPQDHQQFSSAPAAVTVSFSQTIDATQSSLTVFDQYNTPLNAVMTNPKDSTMSVTLPTNLYAGTYRVEWRATCGCKAHNTINGTTYFNIY